MLVSTTEMSLLIVRMICTGGQRDRRQIDGNASVRDGKAGLERFAFRGQRAMLTSIMFLNMN